MSQRPDLALIRLGDWWHYSITLRALCPCGAERPIPMASVLKMFGPEQRWHEGHDNQRLAKALVCGTCGQKGRASVMVVWG
jgi:hypothetical protein